ncbi:MAG: M23 family metallopeptidase [Actinomycetota bacterium]
MRWTIAMALLVGLCAGPIAAAGPAVAAGTWAWPVRGPIVRPYDPPASPYGAGHRGIDVATSPGTVAVAPAPGVVTFAGRVAGQLFVSVDHGAGLVSTSSYLSALLVARDDIVVAGQPIGLTGSGHPGATTAHLHFGVRLGGAYVDPLDYLGPLSLVGMLWLAPIGDPVEGSPPAPGSRYVVLGPGPGTAVPIAIGGPGPLVHATRPSPHRGRPLPA